jgi:prepilin-type N-terminal cleavage/methylation domain-containing protein
MKQKLINLTSQKRKSISAKGFSLIEMIVVIGIISLLSTVTLSNYKEVSSQISLENLVQQIALTIRQAQVYGISVVKGTGSVYPSYGVHFDISTPTSFILFIDSNDNRSYDSSENVEMVTLKNNNIISGIYADKLSTSCVGANVLSSLDIIFTRPNPDAIFYAFNGSTQYFPSDVEIAVRSLGGMYREANVWLTGQIGVGDKACS